MGGKALWCSWSAHRTLNPVTRVRISAEPSGDVRVVLRNNRRHPLSGDVRVVKVTGLRSVGAIRVGSNPTPRNFFRGLNRWESAH
jgi:hypothetical protein